MSKKGKFSKSSGDKKPVSKTVVVLSVIAAVLALGLIVLILMIPKEEPVPTVPTTEEPTTVAPTTEEPTTTPPTTEEPTTAPTEPLEMMEMYVERFNQNPDFAGWISIDGTKLDNPVMYSPDEASKYLYADFNGDYSASGLPYISDQNSMSPEDQNLIIYGHNITDKTMFGAVMDYTSEDYFKKHPIIKFNTLYEEREYEVLACFYDKIYRITEDVFKFYRFYNAETQEEFDEAYNHWKEKSEYDTGVTAEFGDRFITLVTCSYHDATGRFVVVARLIEDEPVDNG